MLMTLSEKVDNEPKERSLNFVTFGILEGPLTVQ